ncbi:DUF4123 domain-containing protein [Vibrio panuliri]|uniref:DUF4123 domain-containing protein n=1 Tax=Vibrio panuliri TaxID=1381081 RepID=A0ABX3FM37_9VIBR|nr:DUF4123 domain-containing protein [Vibrio panuliri]KAB1454907.1 DUF4123 domain-containing protein [Vibrio panuliri]OLQ95276.1 hypothetical protein BIY20_06900 [Vibrio panuliri]
MRTFPTCGELTPASNSPRWMILDGALLPKLEYQVATLGGELNTDIKYAPLLAATRWEKVSDLGPYLVTWSKEIEGWAHNIAPYRYGVIFESDASIDDLETHWKELILCKHSGLENNLTRLYDPIIFLYLLEATEQTRFETWLGPMRNLWLPNLFNQQYREAKSTSTTPKVLKEAFLNDEEWQSLSEASTAYTAWRLIQHIEEYFPDKLQATKQQTHTFVLQQLSDLNQLGQVNEQLATYYLNIICRLGNVLDEDSLYPEITACLCAPKVPLEQRLKQANHLSISLAQNPQDLVENYQ